MDLSDRDLILAMGARDQSAFATFYDRHSPRVYGLLLRILRVPHDAEEVLQEVFWQAWSHCDQYDSVRGEPMAWLALIARSRALDHRRRAMRAPAEGYDGLAPLAAEDASAEAERSEEAQRTRQALAGLPVEQKKAIQFAFFDGLSYSQIAEQEKLPLGTVKTRIRLGMRKLREFLVGDERTALER